jgi:hypothetical protein
MDRSPNTVKGALVWLMAGKSPAKITARGGSCPLSGPGIVSARSRKAFVAKIFGR